MKSLLFSILFLCAGIFSASAQAGKDEIAALVKSRNYTFYANDATPQYSAELSRVMQSIPGSTGSKISLNPVMSQLIVQRDTVSALLPYFGRSQSVLVPSDPNDQGVEFKSTDFIYKETHGKKGNYTISMIINDDKDRPKLLLFVSASGYATLDISFNMKSHISFSGYIEKTRIPRK